MRRIRIAFAMLLTLGMATTTALADWPLFRGNPEQTGLANTSKLPETLAIQWKFKTNGAIEGAPAIVGDTVFIASFDEHLYALNRTDGTLRWKTKLAPMKAPAAVHKNRVFIGDIDGKFYGLDATTGKRLWTYEMGAEITAGANFFGDSILIGSHDQTLYSLTLDGKLNWKYEIDGPINGAAAVVGNKTFVAGCDSMLHMVDADKGKQLGTINLDGQAGATAAISGNQLFVGLMSNQVIGIDWNTQKVLWRFESERRKLPFYSSAAVTDKLVILGGRDKTLYALDRNKGTIAWSFLTDDRIDASPVVVGSKVYFGNLSDDGLFYVLDLATGRELQRLELDGPVLGSPAVGPDCLIVGTESGVVYSLGAGK
ncbi:outer membrane protein assembly factor BamB family protein [Tuwongella immobilis]|uniref:Pyrrolo-quinoline quinone repeat domain-containing protein n=1 Tax=Tuwongella immobilis TaxID=692036 RepID=A0A6C2YSJ1_9BACT|nr:PQQ-binding-like beta-propeller repeat protein [Tuwongella immobilis]VIP04668.1 Probable serine/threonine protein kinase related protein OS=Blastopirellula marina DSM 3645 GN=DSM3645_20192 PE=4 SV=1: PQQ_2: PQQ_2: PQQ_3 [Tuwongella immobilis]VTS06697.1 Probable serine/threonine protein kinase related protein OS=Blastopirellula marina DSM 3645 GN=DSM3645_20192 PE=4 SV=1: PQQ_2: PQQ_2: PQQ_3 [Tuwongella immobilis]